MNVDELMSRGLKTCSQSDTLEHAAQILLEQECGVVPVVDFRNRVVGMITEKDICTAVVTQNTSMRRISLARVAMGDVVTVHPQDSAYTAVALMQKQRDGRLAVVDEGGCLVGLLSLGNLAHAM